MGIDADQLEAEANAAIAELNGAPPAPVAAPKQQQDKPDATDTASELPQPKPEAPPAQSFNDDMPAPESLKDNWQDKYLKAEESRKNAQALMTRATQEAADSKRGNAELQQQIARLQAQVNQLSQQSAQAAPEQPEKNDQFKVLREEYEELGPVFNQVEQQARQNQQLQKELAALKQARESEIAQQQQAAFWNEVRKAHPDVDQVAASADFQGWFARQSQDIQQMSQVNPAGATAVMTMYKAAGTAPTKLQQAQPLSEPQVRSSSAPATQSRTPKLTPDQIAALPQKDYEANEAEYDKMIEQWVKQGGG